MSEKVAIFQNSIIGGGRISVILSFVEILNEMGITPDILTFGLSKPEYELKEKYYNKNVDFKVRIIPRFVKLPGELDIIMMNVMMRKYARNYDILINSNNSFLFLPSYGTIITYMYFPRKRRVNSNLVSIHLPDGEKINPFTLSWLYRKFFRILYKFSDIKENNIVIAQSEFAKKVIEEEYPEAKELNISIINNPVRIKEFWYEDTNRNEEVTTLGRFSADKRQLEQIQIAENIPELTFNIIGFTNSDYDHKYFKTCENYIKSNKIENVKMYSNLPFNDVKNILQRSKFFMHNIRYEPASLVSIQAIAAGCIPITHDSGGEKEGVPYKDLRFHSKEEAIEKLKGLNKKGLDGLRTNLQEHIKKFDEEVFKNRIRNLLEEYL
jgi:glycosyltransferase involved in cell wall biosynthesis